MDLKPAAVTPELATAALACPALSGAVGLAAWVGRGREITNSGVLRPAVAVEACAALGFDLPSGKKPRSALDVPELTRDWDVARAAGLISVSAKRAYGVSADDLTGDPAAVLDAWLRAVAAQFGLPDDPCPECLTVLAVITQAGMVGVGIVDVVNAVLSLQPGAESFCPDCGEIHSFDDPLDEDEEDYVQHAASAASSLAAFGAVVCAEDLLTLTSLGRMLADSVFSALAPAPEDGASAVVSRLGCLPAGAAIWFAGDWLGARTPVSAARELFDFAASASPRQRATAFALAERIGLEAAPAWRERAQVPGYGAYVRAWLAEQGEEAPNFPRDAAWMVAETFSSLLEEVPRELASMALGLVMHEAGAVDIAEAADRLRESGHPDAKWLLQVLGVAGTPQRRAVAPQRRNLAPDDGRPLQLTITLCDVDDPPVWRRVAVPAAATLGDLHDVIQVAMGWEDDHMHVFRAARGGRTGLAEDMQVREALSRRGSRIEYIYDFGDSWEHEIKSDGFFRNDLGISLPACIDGGGACPPEDSGGVWRYEYLKREILADPKHREHEEMLDWLGLDSADDFDPAVFSLDRANERLAALRTSDAASSRPAATVIRLQPRSKKSKARRKR